MANRVSEIHTALPDVEWKHVETADNPADLATSGVSPAELRDFTVWWHGPSWLNCPESQWPINLKNFQTTLEVKVEKSCVHTATVRSDWSNWFERRSKAGRLIHSLSHVFRFIKSVRCTPEN